MFNTVVNQIKNKIVILFKRMSFFKCGNNVYISYSAEIENPEYICLGNNVYIGPDSWILCPKDYIEDRGKGAIIIIEDNVSIGRRAVISGLNRVIIHNNVLLGPNVYISDHIHNYSNIDIPIKKQGISKTKEVEIGENSWIGINASILPGCKIGKNCVVGANSVVTKSFPDYCVIGGIPAKIIKKYSGGKWVEVKEQ